jgi:DNA-binding beta-propeller fold protein YncE
MNASQARVRLVQGGAALAGAALIAGCGSAYRPVVTPITSSGPQPQPSSYAVVVSAPSVTAPGIATIIDYSGDSVLAQAPIGPGPITFSIDEPGANGYTVNSDGTLSNFPITSNLQAKNVLYSTLPSTAQPVNLFTPSVGLFAADLYGNVTDVFSGSPQAFKLAIDVSSTPVMIMGSGTGGQRLFSINQGNVSSPVACNTSPTTAPLGSVNGIELTTDTVSSTIPVGKCPVFAVESPDTRRLFVLNRGDDTISVINAQDNTADSCTPFQNQNGQWITCHQALPLSLTAVNALNAANPGSGNPPNGTSGMTNLAGPVYAEYIPALNELVIADYDGGTISVIDVSEDEYGNDSNTYANSTCTVGGVTSYANCGAITGGFGTTYTIAVGNNPASVTALADGSRAYTANQADQTVSIVTLSSHTVEKTLPVTGHPRTVVSTQNSEQGKVYVASPDTPYLTILRTDLDIVDTTVLVEGNIVDVRVSSQTGGSGNANSVSRTPGYGQPCYLPGASNETSLAVCRTLP